MSVNISFFSMSSFISIFPSSLGCIYLCFLNKTIVVGVTIITTAAIAAKAIPAKAPADNFFFGIHKPNELQGKLF